MIKLASKTEATDRGKDSIFVPTTLPEDAVRLATEIFKSKAQVDQFAVQLQDICLRVKGKDFLIVHNPGGWGHAPMDECLKWERSIVTGVANTVQKMGYSCLVTQYFRTGRRWRQEIADLKEQFRFFSSKANTMAAWVRFILEHVDDIRILLIGVSQGAAFGNAVMQRLDGRYPVYSIELGFPFNYRSRRQNDQRTLATDSDGVRPDKFVQGTMLDVAGILVAAPFKWLIHRIKGNRVLLSHCVTAPGHEYDWANPAVERQITDFLEANFATRKR